MSNWYSDREALKLALSIPVTATANDYLLDSALEGVSRSIDEALQVHAFPRVGVRYYTPEELRCVYLDAPLLAVTSLRTDNDQNGSYETTLSTADYWLTPKNATMESPAQPFWRVELRATSSAYFPIAYDYGVEITGTWGLFDQTKSTTATMSSALATGDSTMYLNGAAALHAGQTLLVDSEQIFVRDINPMSSAVLVERGVNGTSGAAHTSGTAIAVYTYGSIGRATLFQAAMDYRASKAQGDPDTFVPVGGLHPFVLRSLTPYRVPVAR